MFLPLMILYESVVGDTAFLLSAIRSSQLLNFRICGFLTVVRITVVAPIASE